MNGVTTNTTNNVVLSLFTTEQEIIFRYLIITSSVISIVSCLFIIVSYTTFRLYHYFQLKLILLLCTADLGCSIANLVAGGFRVPILSSGNIHVINAVAFSLQFFALCSILWSVCIAHTIYNVIDKKNDKVEPYEKYYHCFVWGISAIFAAILWISGLYGDADIQIWIPRERAEFRYFFFFVPLCLVLICMAALYARTSDTMNEERIYLLGSINHSEPEPRIQCSFRIFVLVLIIAYTPALVNRLQNSFSPTPIFWLNCWHSFCAPLLGFFNAWAYGYNEELREHFRELRAHLTNKPTARQSRIIERLTLEQKKKITKKPDIL